MADFHTKDDYTPELDLNQELDERPSEDELEETVDSLEKHGFEVKVVETGDDALEFVKEKIPSGSSVNTGHSTTLEEIGFMQYLNSGENSWNNLKASITDIDDDEIRQEKRREHTAADYFLGSVNAVSKTGELIAADASGSRVGGYPFAAKNVIIVSGTNKIVDSVEEGRKRLKEFAYPLENERAQDAYGQGSMVGKELIFHHEITEGRTTVVLVKENLGF